MQVKTEASASRLISEQSRSNSSSTETTINTSNFLNLEYQKEQHPAIEYFHQLQRVAPSSQLNKFLSGFNEPKLINVETFTDGVKRFIQLANSNPLDKQSEHGRKALYGNIYSGVHYNNDLVKLWNSSHIGEEPLKASNVTTLIPNGWQSTLQDGFITLIYKGMKPAQALDELVKGPTVIDCGMFTQLALWFGIRNMLGNDRFNECFGRTPFFVTQSVYNGIQQSDKPFSGNPLYSFLSTKELTVTPAVTVKHLTNTPLYPLKHPGGNYGGENCIVIGNHYTIFDPTLDKTQDITESTVLNLLRDTFNADQAKYDIDRLSMYAENPEEFHPKFFKTYGELIQSAKQLREKKLTEKEFLNVKQNPSLELTFDLHKFSTWLQRLENKTQDNSVEYLPQPIDSSLLPVELLNVIPFENRLSMDFSKFKQDTPQQKKLITMSKQFCRSIIDGESKLIILTGKAGVGKTASAVCAAKELTAKGKEIVWISEVMVHGWADQAKSMEELDNCGLAIDNLLAKNPDAVFLDDDNLSGFCGQLLLEKLYSWYVANPGKGLFITSNEPICFKNCYGYKLDGQYHYPPFSPYNSSQYLNWTYRTDLAGESLRSKREGQSIGALVSDSTWKTHESTLGQVELIPAFNDLKELAPIRRSLRQTGSMHCSAYDKLRPIQQQWLDVFQMGGMYTYFGGRSHYEEPHLGACSRKFEKTECKTIALEMREYKFLSGKDVDDESINQLVRVLNYAHDQGGRRVLLINQTSFSNEELLMRIQNKLPKSERERTWSRLMLLLCETEETIFNHSEFNDLIKEPIIQRNSTHELMKKLHSKSFGIKNRLKNLFFDVGPVVSPSSVSVTPSSFDFEKELLTLWEDLIDSSKAKPNLLPISKRSKFNFFNSRQTLSHASPLEDRIQKPKEITEIPLQLQKDISMTEAFQKNEKDFLVQNHSENAELQHEYDKRFGMTLGQ